MTINSDDARTRDHLVTFPNLEARDLDRTTRRLPQDFAGRRNLVLVAFRREHQGQVDAWMAWYESLVPTHPELRAYEVPVLATRWSPGRSVIDGGMARAVPDTGSRRRTMTVYTDVRRVRDALAIDDTDVVTVLLLDDEGRVIARSSGGPDDGAKSALLAALDSATPVEDGEARAIEQFEFAFDPRFRRPLAVLGVTPTTAHVTLRPDRLLVRFGPWSCETPVSNIRAVTRTGPYDWYKAIGPRVSLADRGVTFGTNASAGVCILLREPVRAIDPVGAVHHPGITLTVADPDAFVETLRRRATLD